MTIRSMLSFILASCVSLGLGWKVSEFIPVGSLLSYGTFCFCDANHDGVVELTYTGFRNQTAAVYFMAHRPWNRYVILDSLARVPGRTSWDAWAVGDFDRDSLTDMVVQMDCSLAVLESQTQDSFPKDTAWKWPYEHGGGGVVESFVEDLDQDGRQDIFFTEGRIFYVFENRGNNSYQQVVRESLGVLGIASGDKTWGDFDLDGRTDVVSGYEVFGGPSALLYECMGNDFYVRKWADTIRYPTSYDVFSADDVDGDGRPEFMVGWKTFRGTWTYGFRIYETTGDDQYELIFLDSIMGIRSRRLTAYSDCGDIDSDGSPEIVWAIGDGWYVYKATGNNQFQRIFEAYPRPNGNGHMTTKVYVYDLNGNGYPEIFETGEIESTSTRTETKIWEIEGVRLHRPNGGEVLTPGSPFPITWEKFTPPGADSFSLFVSFNNGVDYQTITTVSQSHDTLFLWSVPDTLVDSCKIMIWAYGPPRAGQNVPRGTAWDFSDSTFRIGQTRVREDTRSTMHDTRLKILQNPTTKAKGVRLLATSLSPNARLQIYDVAGKLVRSFALSPMPSALGPIALRPGVYFVRLETEAAMVTKKVVVVE